MFWGPDSRYELFPPGTSKALKTCFLNWTISFSGEAGTRAKVLMAQIPVTTSFSPGRALSPDAETGTTADVLGPLLPLRFHRCTAFPALVAVGESGSPGEPTSRYDFSPLCPVTNLSPSEQPLSLAVRRGRGQRSWEPGPLC